MDKEIIKIITGIRRSGKSTLMLQVKDLLIGNGVEESQILYLNFESYQNEYLKSKEALYTHVLEFSQHKDKIYLFCDEIQEVEDWQKIVNSFQVDFSIDIYITGSNAYLLSGELATYIAGRYVSFEVFTLSFKEYVEFYPGLDKALLFQDYMRFGGFPFLGLLQDDNAKIEYLKDIYNTIVLKDIMQRNKIRDIQMLGKLVSYMSDNIGNLMNAKKISDYVKKEKRSLGAETIYNYIFYLEQSYLYYKASRFDIKGKRLLESNEKYYLGDHGIRTMLLGNYREDQGRMLENIIFMDLKRRGYEVYVGKLREVEIDFVAVKRERKLYIQVCYSMQDESTMQKEYYPLEKISDNFEKLVISMDAQMPISRTGIRQIPVLEFLLRDDV